MFEARFRDGENAPKQDGIILLECNPNTPPKSKYSILDYVVLKKKATAEGLSTFSQFTEFLFKNGFEITKR